MRRVLFISAVLVMALGSAASADDRTDPVEGGAETIPEAVRVTIVKSGGEHTVTSVSGGGGSQEGCRWSVVFAPELEDTPYGISPGPKPDPEARFALLLCDGVIVRPIWVAPADIVDLDEVARDAAQGYVEDVLVPDVRIGINPAAKGLVGLRSWFWVEGFDGSLTAPPITAFGLTIDVRMSSGSVTWDFGDGEQLRGDLGRAYPAESSVQHTHQTDGTFTITAVIDLVPQYRVDGGPWITLPNLQTAATTQQAVEERQAVITET